MKRCSGVAVVFSLSEKSLEFAFEIRREYALAYGSADLLDTPEATSIKLWGRGTDGTVVNRLVDINELTLSEALEDILPHPLWHEVGDA